MLRQTIPSMCVGIILERKQIKPHISDMHARLGAPTGTGIAETRGAGRVVRQTWWDWMAHEPIRKRVWSGGRDAVGVKKITAPLIVLVAGGF